MRDELLNKVSALIGRYRRADASPDAGFDDLPVLTEIVEDRPPAQATVAPLSAERRAALRDALVAEVTAAIESRLAVELKAELTTRLSALVEERVSAALAGMRHDLAQSIAQLIENTLDARGESAEPPRS